MRPGFHRGAIYIEAELLRPRRKRPVGYSFTRRGKNIASGFFQRTGKEARTIDYEEKLEALSRSEPVARMGEFRHHLATDTLDHCRRVARISFRLSRLLRLRVDEDALLRGAMLHDFYLYERRAERLRPYPHYLRHPGVALRNAEEHFALSEKEKNIILSHMWPIHFRVRPRSREAWLVSVADKLATVCESILGLSGALRRRK